MWFFDSLALAATSTPLHWMGGLLRDNLGRIPLSVVKGVFVAVPLVLVVWVLWLPRERVADPFRSTRWYASLRLWACVVLLVQVGIYCLF